MAVKLRLRRMGRKKKPFYRIIAADSRAPRDGRFIEEIGYYNPLTDPMTIEVKEDRALYWLGEGAIPTDTVKSLLRKKGVTLRFDLTKRGVAADQVEEEVKKWEMIQVEKRQRVEAKKAAAKQQPEPAKPAEVETAPESAEAASEEPAESETSAE